MHDMDTSTIDSTAGEMRAPAVPVPPIHTVAGSAEHATPLASILQRAFSFPAMLGMLLVAGVFVQVRAFNVDPDLWWHLKVGQDILATHHWPTVGPYSFTVARQPWLAF